MTYRTAIQNQIELLEKIYDNAGSLRDCATDEEKHVWNNIRTETRLLSLQLQRLDNKMAGSRAKTELRGQY